MTVRGGPVAVGLSDADVLLGKEDLFRRWASYHEAGHAVAAGRRGLPPGGRGLVIDHRGGGGVLPRVDAVAAARGAA